MLNGKKVLIGITGGIAAYKICELIRMYKRQNAIVQVVCTPNALNFVTKLTLQNLSQNNVATDEFEIPDFKPEHIAYANDYDIFIIAPASANTISKLAAGICDNLLTSIACAFQKPIIIAPAMNTGMYENKIIQKNLKILEDIGYQILEPEDGFLACGTNGKGRLCDLNKIFDKTIEILNRDNFSNKHFQKKIVVTAGGTIEDIDPVRYISNYSSGKMGLAIADEAFKLGLEPVLITTKYIQRPYKVKEVKSALEMKSAVEQEFQNADYVVMAAAVADYRVKNKSEQKIKKSADDILMLELVKNPDILKSLCSDKKHQIIVGFCAESENLENNALEKLKQKGCDFLVANDISRKDIGFNSDYNEVTVFDKFGNSTKLDRTGKNEIAKKILDIILK